LLDDQKNLTRTTPQKNETKRRRKNTLAAADPTKFRPNKTHPPPPHPQQYAEVSEKVTAVASGLAAQGLKRGDRVGVYGANCVEWMLALQVGCRF